LGLRPKPRWGEYFSEAVRPRLRAGRTAPDPLISNTLLYLLGVQGPFVQGIALDELIRNRIPLLGELRRLCPLKKSKR
jgi:hypothetical protein